MVGGAQAQAPAAAPDNSVQAAPELAPGVAPDVVPGAKSGPGAAPPAGQPPAPAVPPAAAAPAPTAAPDLAPGIAPGVVPGAKPGPAAPPPASSHAAGSPDWPCQQRKVYKLTSTQIWDGPPVDDLKGWENDEKISELTTFLESRRVPLEDAEKVIKEFAASVPEGERDQKLTLLFASELAKINSDRSFVIGRVEEFQRRQKARSEELEREGQKLAEMNQTIPADEQLGPRDANLTPEQQQYNWNARIFQERQSNLTVACEIPVLIEQRAYEIGRLIREQMKS
jgi:hypothetical protein